MYVFGEFVMNALDWIIIIAVVFLLLMSQGLLLMGKRKPKAWQEQNAGMIKKYSRAQFLLMILFIVYLLVMIFQKIK